MDKSDWELLQAVFHDALALPEAEREAFVAERLEDATLRREALSLLNAAGDDPDNDALLEGAFANPVDADVNLEGELLGAYRILEKVGDGGMGAVYLGERADGTFEKQVAVKVVRKGMDTAAVVARFEQERTILARLQHPNIAGVLDGGITADGRPYFVMEYVDGVPITQYSDQQGLSIHARLRLFNQVCRAVQYAHQNLVVHRDLKPSNILVPADGTPKLLDFGIAKLLAEEDDAELTRTGMLLATPAYAAPEQLTSGNITTGTDVYALGVLLYELLTGRRPFETRRTPDEYRQMVLSGDPLRPSTALTQQPSTSEAERATRVQTIEAARGAQTTKLRSLLRGDLDNICLTAIMREPELRYATAAALAADITNHLEGRTIEARGQSFGYRARKFYSRNRPAVLASAVGAVLLATLGLYHANRITAERDIAIEEKEKTEEVVQFVTSLFLAADPAQARGTDITARELLDAGMQKIETEMSGRPAVQATMKRVLGGVYYELGEHEDATRLLQEAVDTHSAVYGEQHLETAESWLAKGINEQTVGDFDAARTSLTTALAIRRTLLPGAHEDVVEALSAQAFFAETNGEYDRAEALHRQALAMARELAVGNEDLYVAAQMAKLASLYRLQDRLDEAEELLTDALAMQDRLYGGAHPESDETKRQLAELLADRRKFEAADALYQELIASRTKMLGADHYETGSAWNSYGHLLAARGDAAGARDAYTRMLEITRKNYGDTHPALAAGYNNVAVLARNMGDLDGALENYRLCLAMQDAVGVPVDHPNRAYPVAGKGRVYLLQRRFEAARDQFLEAMRIRLDQLSEDHILVVELKSDIGAAYTELGAFDRAEAPLLAALAVLRSNWGDDDPRSELTAARLKRYYELTGQSEKAADYAELAAPAADDTMLQYF